MKKRAISILIISIILTSFTIQGLDIDQKVLLNRKTNPIKSDIVLITGFGPFGRFDKNPSEMISNNLNGSFINDFLIIGITVPVNFTESVEVVSQAIDEYQPKIVISLGLHGNSRIIRVEKLGLNIKKIKDEQGNKKFEKNEPDGPIFRMSNFPTIKIAQSIRRQGIPAITSFNAGTYVCNALLYGIIGYVTENNLDIKTGFIHVPLLPDQGEKNMEFDDMLKSVIISIECLTDNFY